MTFNNYISALFYLLESLRYTTGEVTRLTKVSVEALCEEAFSETGVVGFKLYKELQDSFPGFSLFIYSPKHNIRKTSFQCRLRRDLSAEELKQYQLTVVNDFEVKPISVASNLFNGDVVVEHVVQLDSEYDNNFNHILTGTGTKFIHIHVHKGKTFTEADLQVLKNIINLAIDNKVYP